MLNISMIHMVGCTCCERKLNLVFLRKKNFNSACLFPKISFGTIWWFMIEGVDSKKQLLTAMPLIKGFNFFKSSHVLYIGNLHEIEKQHTYIKSQSVGLNVHKFN